VALSEQLFDEGFDTIRDEPFILTNKEIFRLTERYKTETFSGEFVMDHECFRFLLIPRLFKTFSYPEQRQRARRAGRLLPCCYGSAPHAFYREYEIFHPSIPARPSSFTPLQNCSRLLMSLSTDGFHGNEEFVTSRVQDCFPYMMIKHHIDLVALPLDMPTIERALVSENACWTMVNLLPAENRPQSEIWRKLLELEPKYFRPDLKETDSDEEVFKKLANLRHKSRCLDDRRFFIAWILASVCALYLLSFLRILFHLYYLKVLYDNLSSHHLQHTARNFWEGSGPRLFYLNNFWLFNYTLLVVLDVYAFFRHTLIRTITFMFHIHLVTRIYNTGSEMSWEDWMIGS